MQGSRARVTGRHVLASFDVFFSHFLHTILISKRPRGRRPRRYSPVLSLEGCAGAEPVEAKGELRELTG